MVINQVYDKKCFRKFPCDPVVRTLSSQRSGLILGKGTKIPEATQHGQINTQTDKYMNENVFL